MVPVAWFVVMWYTPYSASPHLLPCLPSMPPGEVAPMCDLALDVQHLGRYGSEGMPASVDWTGG